MNALILVQKKSMQRITELLKIKYPIIQAGMVWCSGWRLASAVSNAGGLGTIGAGSMSPSVLEEHLVKCKNATQNPFAVNLPLIYSQIKDQIDLIVKHQVKIVITSAGNPATYTPFFKQHGIVVVHVVSNTKFAIKAQEAGVNAIVAEGFEAGGHNGREETTTFCLLPLIKNCTNLPVIAAGGIYNANGMLAAFALGAEAVQIGSRFAVCKESSAHKDYKNMVFNAKEGDTALTLKEITLVRLLKNKFYKTLQLAYAQGNDAETLKNILGKGRARAGIFEGNTDEGELEIGQVSALLNKTEDAANIIHEIVTEFDLVKAQLCKINI